MKGQAWYMTIYWMYYKHHLEQKLRLVFKMKIKVRKIPQSEALFFASTFCKYKYTMQIKNLQNIGFIFWMYICGTI
jgi:hypothetical protein